MKESNAYGFISAPDMTRRPQPKVEVVATPNQTSEPISEQDQDQPKPCDTHVPTKSPVDSEGRELFS